MELRLNKFISDSGLCSRREADKLIEKGKVTINGRMAKVGDKISGRENVRVDGHIIEKREETVYIALNKPAGITCTTDQNEPENVVDFVNYPSRIFNIGRLDKPSEGLLLLTNDGNIVNKILRASNNHEKEYIVGVNKPIDDEFIKKMSCGVAILGQVTKRCKVEKINDTRFKIILTQGLNRQIRRMCETLGYEVVKLRRIRIMNIKLDNLSQGDWRFLTEQEMNELNALLIDSESTAPAKSKRPSLSKKSTQSPNKPKQYSKKTQSHSNKKSRTTSNGRRTPSKSASKGRRK